MVTRNFLNILAMALQSGHPWGCLPVKAVTGENCFISGDYGFPYGPAKTFTLTAGNAGISIGTGTTPATEYDYQLEAPITSGVTVTLTGTVYGADSPWRPFVKYELTVTNTGSAPLTVTEIGYKQTCKTSHVIGSTKRNDYNVLLIDRSVLAEPVTIAAGDAGVITYKLRTTPEPTPDPVAGIEMAGFTYGSDEQIAAILDAAAVGTIDLQRDAGWRVGDQRMIELAAFTGGNDTAVPAQRAAIVITSFDEYMGCGNLLQFDFASAISSKFRMDANAPESGYDATEMFTTTLPAMAEALPAWLRTRLKTFSVLTNTGRNSTTIKTVPGNKLALRSDIEVFGANQITPAIEDGALIPYYAETVYNRIKPWGMAGDNVDWWTRTPYSGGFRYTAANGGNSGSSSSWDLRGVAPFGCV